ncbi:uncharacterized protein LOC131636797 [Vicia villosa]|uniref:uncharacterized protein LOC131636797 n=1 Tax=Vicia villosa TaxID=3911 RepID=UPI00273B06B5|nr:uncharacterized protein LOC131636797 [Vicia villosa]
MDFDSLETHEFHLKEDMLFQGWTSLFSEFCGPVYPELVKEFWVHAVVDPKSILSFVHGRTELPEVRTKYLNSLKEDKAKYVLAKVSRKKASTSKSAVSEVASESVQEVVVNKERRKKRKFDRSSNQEKEVQEEAAAVVDKDATENDVVVEAVLVENEQEAEKEKVVKRKRKKTKKDVNVEAEKEVEKENTNKRRRLIIVESEEEEEIPEAVNHQVEENQDLTTEEAETPEVVNQVVENQEAVDKENERLASARKREIALGKEKIVEEQKNKKQKRLEAEFEAIQNMSKGIHLSEPASVSVLCSEFTPTDVAQSPEPENQPEKAPSESPQHTNVLIPPSPPVTKVLTPPLSPVTNPTSDQPLDSIILDIQSLQTVFPPQTNISISQPPPHANFKPISSPSQNNPSLSDLLDSALYEQLLRDCNYTPKPRPEPELTSAFLIHSFLCEAASSSKVSSSSLESSSDAQTLVKTVTCFAVSSLDLLSKSSSDQVTDSPFLRSLR